MKKILSKFIEQQLSSFGILELELETESRIEGTALSYSLFLNGFSLNFDELGHIDIDIYYNNHQKLTYELGKYSFPLYTNSKSNQRRLLELLINTPLYLNTSFDKIEKNSYMNWDRYVISLTGVKATNMEEFITMIEVFKQLLVQVKQEQLDYIPELTNGNKGQ